MVISMKNDWKTIFAFGVAEPGRPFFTALSRSNLH